jgi:predicted nucleotidyltransferase
MKEYLSIPFRQREEIIQKIKQAFLKERDVIFAFVFGSFLDAPSFRDIDIGIYMKDYKKSSGEIFDDELRFSIIAAETCGLSFSLIEVKILNFAPTNFLNNIFKSGQILFSRDEKFLTDIIENTSLNAIANEHIARQSLREFIPV